MVFIVVITYTPPVTNYTLGGMLVSRYPCVPANGPCHDDVFRRTKRNSTKTNQGVGTNTECFYAYLEV